MRMNGAVPIHNAYIAVNTHDMSRQSEFLEEIVLYHTWLLL